MKELPVRKHPRLKGYDYSQNGAYFVTFCVKGGHEMLGRVVGRDALGAPSIRDAHGRLHIELSDYGEAVRREIEETQICYDGVVVDKYVVMPNHVHLIIHIKRNGGVIPGRNGEVPGNHGAPRASRPTSALVPNIVAVIKRKTNKAFGFNMWQKSYHDHIIRDEDEYQRIWQYIDENPAKWTEDKYYG